MSYDGITMAAVCRELNEKLTGARVEKIYQPGSLEIYFHLRTKESSFVLLCCADARLARVHLTSTSSENPAAAPSFCMLLRKHLGGARFISAGQSGLDRVLTLTFRGHDDFGTQTKKQLICEIMGKHSNLILTASDNENTRILGSAKIISHAMSRHRTVMPGEIYILPPAQLKLDLQGIKEEELALALAACEKTPAQALVATVTGLGMEVSRELLYRASGGDNLHPLEIVRPLTIELRNLGESLQHGTLDPCIARSRDGRIHTFAPILLTQFPPDWLSTFPSVNETLDSYYTLVINLKKESELKNRLLQVVSGRFARADRKRRLQQRELREMKGADRFRVFGEILTANFSQVRQGASEAVLPNFYTPAMDSISIPLDPAISVQANAQRYFKKYRKLKDGEKILLRRLQETKKELAYLDSLLASLEYADLESLREIQAEMEQAGILRAAREKKQKTAAVSVPLHFVSTDGIDIYVGRNNSQNDRLTLKSALPEDTWLHVKDIPGAHVIVKGAEPSEETLIEAARLAVRYSRAAASSNVPVDYTHARYVRKPKGAKPGMVIYTNHRTLYVTNDD